MAAQPWAQHLVQSFTSADQPQVASNENAYNENAYNGPYTRLLYYLFGLEDPFGISPRYHILETSRDAMKVVALFAVEFNKHPIFCIEVKPPAEFLLESKRKRADDQIRDRFRDLRRNRITPCLPAISAFGTRLCFYEYTVTTNTVMPSAVCADPAIRNDMSPVDRWDCDLFDMGGNARVCHVAQDVRTMCQTFR